MLTSRKEGPDCLLIPNIMAQAKISIFRILTQEAIEELEHLIEFGGPNVTMKQLTGAFPFALDTFQARSVEVLLQGELAPSCPTSW